MIVVTGAAGFIGSNLLRALGARGERDLVAVDHLRDGAKFVNMLDAPVADYRDRDDFIRRVLADDLPFDVHAVFHQGACSDTTEWDGRFMMRNNFEYSKLLLNACLARGIPFIYASSAAVYGAGRCFRERPECERPLNVYGYSKYLFDCHVRRVLPAAGSQVVGLRYFNVYGPGEAHKGPMASVAYQLHLQRLAGDRVRLFEGADGHGDGEQRRDFVHVSDIAALNLWFLDHPGASGIFNAGTGRAQSFNDVARAVLAWHGGGDIEYIAFPDSLRGRYQSFTEADLSDLRDAGFDGRFMTVEQGVRAYLDAIGSPAAPR